MQVHIRLHPTASQSLSTGQLNSAGTTFERSTTSCFFLHPEFAICTNDRHANTDQPAKTFIFAGISGCRCASQSKHIPKAPKVLKTTRFQVFYLSNTQGNQFGQRESIAIPVVLTGWRRSSSCIQGLFLTQILFDI